MDKIESIIKKIPDKRASNISKPKRAEIIMDLANGKTIRKTAKDNQIALKTAQSIKNESKPIIEAIQTKEVIDKERILNKYLNLLERKADRISDDEAKLDYTRITELSGTTKDMYNMVQTDRGESTTEYNKVEPIELLKELKSITLAIEQGDTKKLLQATFNDNNDLP